MEKMGPISFANERFENARDHGQTRTWTKQENRKVVQRISNKISVGQTNERMNRREHRLYMTNVIDTSANDSARSV